MPPKLQPNGKAPRSCQTRAQIQTDLLASGQLVGSKQNAAAVKRSRLAAVVRARGQTVVQTSSAKATKDSPPLDLVDYQTVIAYLSKPNFHNAVFGGGSQTRVSGLPMGPSSFLNPLAIEINHNYNIQHNTTSMHLNGPLLYLRLKRYKSKYMAAHNFSIKTGSGLSAKNWADGIHKMKDLLESMCPCFKEMDVIFCERGNVTVFGILNTGVGPQGDDYDDSDDGGMTSGHHNDSDGDITDCHDHTLQLSISHPASHKGLASANAEQPPITPDVPHSNTLNNHYRDFINDRFSSPPPTPDDTNDALANQKPTKKRVAQVPLTANELALDDSDNNSLKHTMKESDREAHNKPTKKGVAPVPLTADELALEISDDKPPKAHKKPTKKRVAPVPLTAKELALNNSDDKPLKQTTNPVTRAGKKCGAPRSTLSRRALDPLPSIDPSQIQGKEHKHALATAIQQGNKARLEMIAKGNELYQHVRVVTLLKEATLTKGGTEKGYERLK